MFIKKIKKDKPREALRITGNRQRNGSVKIPIFGGLVGFMEWKKCKVFERYFFVGGCHKRLRPNFLWPCGFPSFLSYRVFPLNQFYIIRGKLLMPVAFVLWVLFSWAILFFGFAFQSISLVLFCLFYWMLPLKTEKKRGGRGFGRALSIDYMMDDDVIFFLPIFISS